MKAEFVNPFISSTLSVFKTMIGMDPVKGDLYIKSDEKLFYDVSGAIGLVGDFVGYVSISFPEDLALEVGSQFLGEEITELNNELGDAVGEIINMVTGSAKKHFSDKGKKFNISVPNVVVGKGHTIQRPANIICIGVKFHLNDKIFVVEVAMKEKK
ncbi:chemotaxis protein CheX [Limisalsivibrio acetivorans]|uniref:chemotaxis protein CheX n=1 Tax=Limisalsivibrio acetivorans TaxID=1304888 RepID=UPI0003B555FB|nr:chemotaxis protein CheX [Limisalsivibrio acetivorans]